MSAPPYKRPEPPKLEELQKSTERYAAHNAAIRERHAKASDRHVMRTNAGLDELAEAARAELLTQCGIGKELDDAGDDPELRLQFYAGFREACREFFAALGATPGSARQGNRLGAMWEAIHSLDRYRGAGR